MWELPFLDFRELNSERVHLRKLDLAKDVASIYKIRSNPDVLKYIDRDPPTNESEIVDFINLINSGFETSENISWGITLKGNDTVIGIMGYWRITKEHHRGEIGYTLHPDYWRKGIMDETMKLVLPFAFKEMKLHSIEANINPENDRSRQLLLRNGFVKEAYFRENYYAKGKFLDSEIYSRLNDK